MSYKTNHPFRCSPLSKYLTKEMQHSSQFQIIFLELYFEEDVALSLVVKQNTSFNVAVTYLTRMQDLSHHKFLEPRSKDDIFQVLSARFHALPLPIVQVLTHPVGAYWVRLARRQISSSMSSSSGLGSSSRMLSKD